MSSIAPSSDTLEPNANHNPLHPSKDQVREIATKEIHPIQSSDVASHQAQHRQQVTAVPLLHQAEKEQDEVPPPAPQAGEQEEEVPPPPPPPPPREVVSDSILVEEELDFSTTLRAMDARTAVLQRQDKAFSLFMSKDFIRGRLILSKLFKTEHHAEVGDVFIMHQNEKEFY